MDIINPKNVIELLSTEFSFSSHKTPINSTERKLASSLAAAINNWTEEPKEVEEIASLNFSLDNEINNEESQQVLDEIRTLERSEIGSDNENNSDNEIATLEKSSELGNVDDDRDEIATLERENDNNNDLLSTEGTLSEIPSIQDENEIEVFDSFEKMIHRSALLRGIYSYGFEKPSSIQKHAGRDIIALAPLGSGKTTAFSIGLLQPLRIDIRETQSLVLAHTRESAVHIQKVILALGEYMNINCCACIGGTDIRELIRKLDYGQHLVTGTPKVVLKMIQRRNLRTRSIKILVLDEADELFRGFSEEIKDIYRYLPANVQVVLVASKLPNKLLEMTKTIIAAPVIIKVKSCTKAKNCPTFFNINAQNEGTGFRLAIVKQMFGLIDQIVIFCNTREMVNFLRNLFNKEGISVCCLHSELKSKERIKILKLFSNDACRVLITTDISFHGLDISKVKLVINFDLPYQFDIYIQRINHSCSRNGVVINFVEIRDSGLLHKIEKHYSTKIRELPLII